MAWRHCYTPICSAQRPFLRGIPAPVLARLKRLRIGNVFVKKEARSILPQIVTAAAAQGMRIMLIKGEALNYLVYDQPWYTVSADIDLILSVKKAELPPAAFGEIDQKLYQFNQRPAQFKQHIEYEFYEHHDMSMNNILRIDWPDIWRDAQRIPLGDTQLLAMSDADLLLAAAINCGRKRYFRLKNLCDMASIIESRPDLDWDAVIRKAHAYRCNTILYTAFAAAQATLGCRLPADILPSLGVSGARARLITAIIRRIGQRVPLAELVVPAENTAYKRKLSWTLLLTYATYRPDLLPPKFKELITASYNSARP